MKVFRGEIWFTECALFVRGMSLAADTAARPAVVGGGESHVLCTASFLRLCGVCIALIRNGRKLHNSNVRSKYGTGNSILYVANKHHTALD